MWGTGGCFERRGRRVLRMWEEQEDASSVRGAESVADVADRRMLLSVRGRRVLRMWGDRGCFEREGAEGVADVGGQEDASEDLGGEGVEGVVGVEPWAVAVAVAGEGERVWVRWMRWVRGSHGAEDPGRGIFSAAFGCHGGGGVGGSGGCSGADWQNSAPDWSDGEGMKAGWE
ncbi:hypothetical protein CYMTET_4479 [Cymbomonas tetramitiformis]|uniref:Uncharacterized protein n=1 Tax=Cymbomonas tetramitiformis TaxID=36881 RepID=A0AAE0H190_9CHLO|nr:hypothetical protein CYMTET_4479 [Cymbomonas tetramitiformis]